MRFAISCHFHIHKSGYPPSWDYRETSVGMLSVVQVPTHAAGGQRLLVVSWIMTQLHINLITIQACDSMWFTKPHSPHLIRRFLLNGLRLWCLLKIEAIPWREFQADGRIDQKTLDLRCILYINIHIYIYPMFIHFQSNPCFTSLVTPHLAWNRLRCHQTQLGKWPIHWWSSH